MKMTRSEYNEYIKRRQSPSPLGKDMLLAFLTGGAICCVGQALRLFYTGRGLSEEDAGTAVSVTLVLIGAVLTALGVYDDIARFAGAGTLVPITGFSNAVCSPALEFRREGLITGTCARMFVIAGPVIVCGISASVVYGLILLLTHTA